MKVLLVCLGNICRSPMAEGILREKVNQAGLDVEIDSAGTGDFHIGEAPDKRAQEAVKRNGIDISSLRARQIKAEDLEKFDKIYVMDKSNYEDVAPLAKSNDQKSKIDLFLNLSHPSENRVVPDPYFGGEDGFQHVYKLLDEACDAFVIEMNGKNG